MGAFPLGAFTGRVIVYEKSLVIPFIFPFVPMPHYASPPRPFHTFPDQ